VPKPSQRTFETAIIERYRRHESSVEEALIDIVVHCTATSSANSFPNGQSALNLAAARLRHIAGIAWSINRYLNVELLNQCRAPLSSKPQTAQKAVKAVTDGMVTMIFRS
jgi:hypothetical protein